MGFVRVKRIYGQEYGYWVENTWTSKGPRQKVGKYLGKIYRPNKAKSESLESVVGSVRQFLSKSEFSEIARALITLELRNHGVEGANFEVDFEARSVRRGKKRAVLALNEGFLCDHTLGLLLDYDPGKDYSGYLLADVLTGAGIIPDKEVFIQLYGKFKADFEAAAARKFDFYY